jgi:uncharacterized OB-fold protein
MTGVPSRSVAEVLAELLSDGHRLAHPLHPAVERRLRVRLVPPALLGEGDDAGLVGDTAGLRVTGRLAVAPIMRAQTVMSRRDATPAVRFATGNPRWQKRNWNTFQFFCGSRYADRVSAASTQPAIDGWFATDSSGSPYLIGGKCHRCGTYVFPPRADNCPNPACDGDELAQVPLSRRGTLWSYTENRYAPPPPYPSPDPFEPFAVAAVQLADEGLIVLGKVVEGTLAADLRVGMAMELTTMPLFVDDDGVERIVYAWRIA